MQPIGVNQRLPIDEGSGLETIFPRGLFPDYPETLKNTFNNLNLDQGLEVQQALLQVQSITDLIESFSQQERRDNINSIIVLLEFFIEKISGGFFATNLEGNRKDLFVGISCAVCVSSFAFLLYYEENPELAPLMPGQHGSSLFEKLDSFVKKNQEQLKEVSPLFPALENLKMGLACLHSVKPRQKTFTLRDTVFDIGKESFGSISKIATGVLPWYVIRTPDASSWIGFCTTIGVVFGVAKTVVSYREKHREQREESEKYALNKERVTFFKSIKEIVCFNNGYLSMVRKISLKINKTDKIDKVEFLYHIAIVFISKIKMLDSNFIPRAQDAENDNLRRDLIGYRDSKGQAIFKSSYLSDIQKNWYGDLTLEPWSLVYIDNSLELMARIGSVRAKFFRNYLLDWIDES